MCLWIKHELIRRPSTRGPVPVQSCLECRETYGFPGVPFIGPIVPSLFFRISLASAGDGCTVSCREHPLQNATVIASRTADNREVLGV